VREGRKGGRCRDCGAREIRGKHGTTKRNGVERGARATGRRYTERDETTRKDVEGEREKVNAEQEEARKDGREEEPRPVCASASESD